MICKLNCPEAHSSKNKLQEPKMWKRFVALINEYASWSKACSFMEELQSYRPPLCYLDLTHPQYTLNLRFSFSSLINPQAPYFLCLLSSFPHEAISFYHFVPNLAITQRAIPLELRIFSAPPVHSSSFPSWTFTTSLCRW